MSDSGTILGLVLDNIPQGVFWKDRNSVYLGCNRVVCKTLGLTGPHELIGKSDYQFPSLTKAQADAFVEADREVMRTGVPLNAIIEPMNRFDGATIWIETIKVPLRDESGNVIGVLGTWQEVTSRRQAEEALRRGEQRYRSLVTAISELVWTSNATGSGLRVDPPLEDFTGLDRNQLRGSGWLQAVHPDDRERATSAWSHSALTVAPYECEFRLKRADGEWRNIHSRGIPIRDPAGTLLEWIGVGVDVTERRRAEIRIQKLHDDLERRVLSRTSELEAANKELEAFSYSVSHDLRAPLRAIDGFSRILLSEHAKDLPPEAMEFLNDIRTNSRMMGQLIDDLLKFSRLSRHPIQKVRIQTAELVRVCLEELKRSETGRDIRVKIGELPDCWADQGLLKQVWINLIANAFKYSSKRAVTEIEIGSGNDAAGEPYYFIQDNGIGFDMRYVHKLFGVFQRLHRAEDYEGAGVGLATVQRVIHRHGGNVWAEGEPNRGAKFYFTLPERGLSP
jgi:PAS domain S-box-containing protein